MKLIKLFSAMLVVMGLSSCLGETNNTVTQDFTNYCVTYVSDGAGQSVMTAGTGYKVVTNLDKGTMSLDITNLRLPNNANINISIPDQRYGFNTEGATTLSVPSYVSNANGTTHTVTNLKLEMYSRYLSNQSFPIIVMNYTVDAMYDVRVIYNPSYYWGTTTVTDESGNVYENKELSSFYGVQFNTETHKALFGCVGAKFAANMPAMNMTFSNLDYDVTTYNYLITGDNITPTIGETPYPSFKITDFRLDGVWGGNQYLSFKCTIDTESVKGTYTVNATLSILPPSVTNND